MSPTSCYSHLVKIEEWNPLVIVYFFFPFLQEGASGGRSSPGPRRPCPRGHRRHPESWWPVGMRPRRRSCSPCCLDVWSPPLMVACCTSLSGSCSARRRGIPATRTVATRTPPRSRDSSSSCSTSTTPVSTSPSSMRCRCSCTAPWSAPAGFDCAVCLCEFADDDRLRLCEFAAARWCSCEARQVQKPAGLRLCEFAAARWCSCSG